MSVHTVRGSLLDVSLGTASSPVARVAAVAFAVALTAAAAQFTVPVPFTAVPFTLTPLVVLLAGAALGSRLALPLRSPTWPWESLGFRCSRLR